VTALTAGLAMAGAVAAFAGRPGHQWKAAGPWWTALPLLAALVMAGRLQVDFSYRGHLEALDLFETALVPTVLLFAGPVAVALAVVAKAVSQRLLHVSGRKAAFNVASWAASTGVASWVYLSLGGAGLGATNRVPALVAGMVAAMLVNHLALATVMGLVSETGLRGALAGLSSVIVPGWLVGGAINLACGVLFAIVAWRAPALVALILVPLVMLNWAERAYAEARTDRARLQALQRATHDLAAPVDPLEGVPDFLASLLDCFQAAGVAVVVDGGAGFHCGEADTEDTCRLIARRVDRSAAAHRVRANDGSAAGQVLAATGRRSALVAPLWRDRDVTGLLVSLDRDGLAGFDDGEVAVFEALAGELANALQKAELHAALVRERAKLLDIVTRSSDGIFTVATDGSLETWNRAMEDITGFTAAEAVGHRGLGVLRPRDARGAHVAFESWTESWAKHGVSGMPDLPSELEILTRAGEKRWLSCSIAPNRAGPLVVVVRDVTRQRELDRMKDDFVAAVSHELRTPLSSIIGSTEMLADRSRPLNDDQRARSLSVLRRGARRLERLVLNLLEVSLVEAPGAEGAAGPLDMDQICVDVVDELSQSFPAARIHLSPAPKAVVARGNRASVEQILSNLVANALKYGDSTPISLAFVVAGGELTVTVTDGGPGIPVEYQARIFERFERFNHDHVQGGTGLGLYISRQLALSMGGELWVSSVPGRGATFGLRLPAEVRLAAVPGEGEHRGNRVG